MQTKLTTRVEHMPVVGDRVRVTIRGGVHSSTQLGGTIAIGPGSSMTVDGRITRDLGDSWEVQLAIAVGGNDRIVVPKSALRVT